MTRTNILLRSVLLAIVIAVVSAAPSAGAVGPLPEVSGPPSTPGLPTVPPAPVCNPSWGSIVIPICI